MIQGISQYQLQKIERQQKDSRSATQKQKISQMIDQFYAKSQSRIEKSLSKDNKKTFLLCKQLYSILSLRPHQQQYEIARVNDLVFNQILKLNQLIADFLKRFEALQSKISEEISIQKLKNQLKQEKAEVGDIHVTVLRKISFKREKTAFTHKLKSIDTINKKIMKLQQIKKNQLQEIGFYLQIEGKRRETEICYFTKIWFQIKNKQYLLCISKKNANLGQMFILNDKLQLIASFNKISIDLDDFLDIVQIEHSLFVVYEHRLQRLSLMNPEEQIETLFCQSILGVQSYKSGLLLWAMETTGAFSLIFVNNQLQIYYQIYLKSSINQILTHFKLNKDEQIIYYVGCIHNGYNLYQIRDNTTKQVLTTIGDIIEFVPIRKHGKNQSYIFRKKGNQFYRFNSNNYQLTPLEIDLECGQSIIKCAILGEHLYCLHSGGKYMLQCHFRQ